MLRSAVVLGTIAVCLANSIALIPGNTSPLVVGGLIAGLGLGVADAGLILSCELILMGIAATLLATQMARINTRTATLLGAVLVLTGHGFAAWAGTMEQVLVWRCIGGVGAGIVIAAVNATIAGAPNPHRLYGVALMVPPLVGAIVAFFMSRAIGEYAHAGSYGVLALLTFIVIPFLLAFPNYHEKVMSTGPEPLREYGPGMALLLGILITGTNMMAYFVFAERLGDRLDLTIERIGEIFAIVVIAGAAGAAIAGLLENRIGIRLPLIAGVILHAVAMILALEVVALPAYIVGVILEGAAFVFILTFQFAAAAMLDSSGRWAAAAGGAFSLSLGIGPFLGGALIEAAGFRAITILTLVSTLLVVVLFWWASMRAQNSSVSGGPEGIIDKKGGGLVRH